jgi:hypothetical protein
MTQDAAQRTMTKRGEPLPSLALLHKPSLNEAEEASPLCWHIPKRGQHLESLKEKEKYGMFGI